jgi:uncharacterized protein YbaP (TraB family)
MKKNLFSIILLVVLVSSALAQSSNSLLWKATQIGKKPLYLYGTIHIRDKSVFNLSDSTYKAIKNSDLVAGELDLENMIYDIFKNLYSKDSSNLLSKKMDPKKFNELQNDISSSSGIDISQIDAKNSWMIDLLKDRHDWKTEESKSKETFLDAYIIRLAQQWGKTTTGIEVMDDYSKIASDFEKTGKSIYSDQEALTESFDVNAQQYLLNLYLSEDIRELFAITDKSMNEYERYSLSQRNVNMVTRIDSICAAQQLFFAVGAAHLAGKSGLIELLKLKGYTLTPVKCPTSTLIKQVELSKTSYNWTPFTAASNQYRLEMPKKQVTLPYTKDGISGEIFLAPDIFNNTYFMAIEMKVPYTITKENANTLLDRFASGFANRSNTTEISSSISDAKEFPSLNILTKSQDLYYNSKVYLLHDKIIFLSVYGNKKSTQSEDALRFLNSFKYLNFAYASISKGMREFSDSLASIRITMPDNLQMSGPYGEESASYYVRSATAKEGSFYYMVYDFNKQIDDETESLIITNTVQVLSNKKGIETITTRDTLMFKIYQGIYGEFLEKEKKIFVNMIMFFYNNRMYQFYSESKNQVKSKEKFNELFSSAVLLAPSLLPNNWYTTSDSLRFLSNGNPDSSNYEYNYGNNLPTLSFHDTNTGMQTVLKTKETSSYLVLHNPEQYLFNQFKETLSESGDTISSDPLIKDDFGYRKTYYSYENRISRFWGSSKDSNRVYRTTLYQTYEKLFILRNAILAGNENCAYLKGIHNSLKFVGTATSPKSFSTLINDLSNKDTLISFMAYDQMDGASISEKELPVLKNALRQSYELDQLKPDNYYEPVREKLISILLTSTPTGFEDFIVEQYKETSDLSLRRTIISATLPSFSFSEKDSTPCLTKLIETELPLDLKQDSSLIRKIETGYYNKGQVSYIQTLINHRQNPEYHDWIVMALENIYRDSIQEKIISDNKDALHELILHSFQSKLSDTSYAHKADAVQLVENLNSEKLLPLITPLRKDKDAELRKQVCLTEIKLSGTCDLQVLEEVCKDPLMRFDVYSKLVGMGKVNLFPEKYKSQEQLALSIFMITLSNEEEVYISECAQIGKRTKKINGVKGTQYMYRYHTEGETEWYYGVSGAYTGEVSGSTENYESYSGSEEYLGEKASVLFKRMDKSTKKFLREYKYEF